MHFKLWQIRHDSEAMEKYGFMSYKFALEHAFDIKDYECTYEMEVDSDHNLDDFFVMFNMDRPVDFKGRSLSVSDIIELDGHRYYCDDFDWEEIK